MHVPQASSKPDTTITIDGNPGDWVAITPIAWDPPGDGDDGYDLLECYVTNDGSNLYFMIKVRGEIQPAGEERNLPYSVGLDTDQNRATGETEGSQNVPLDIGLDYLIVVPTYKIGEAGRYSSSIFRASSEERWEELPGVFSSSFANSVLEFGCPLSTIGYPEAIDMVFVGKPFAENLDFAPNQTAGPKDYVTYYVAPPLIKADGKIGDWVGISPLAEVSDPEGDVPRGSDEDILHCYVTNDRETLYVRIDIKGGLSAAEFFVGLDTDINPATGWTKLGGLPLGIGMDYIVDYLAGESIFFPAGAGLPGYLSSLPAQDVEPLVTNVISSGWNGSAAEFAIPLRWIGNPSRIDIVGVIPVEREIDTIIEADITDPLRYEVYVSPIVEITNRYDVNDYPYIWNSSVYICTVKWTVETGDSPLNATLYFFEGRIEQTYNESARFSIIKFSFPAHHREEKTTVLTIEGFDYTRPHQLTVYIEWIENVQGEDGGLNVGIQIGAGSSTTWAVNPRIILSASPSVIDGEKGEVSLITVEVDPPARLPITITAYYGSIESPTYRVGVATYTDEFGKYTYTYNSTFHGMIGTLYIIANSSGIYSNTVTLTVTPEFPTLTLSIVPLTIIICLILLQTQKRRMPLASCKRQRR
jgi:hypothetical protein